MKFKPLTANISVLMNKNTRGCLNLSYDRNKKEILVELATRRSQRGRRIPGKTQTNREVKEEARVMQKAVLSTANGKLSQNVLR